MGSQHVAGLVALVAGLTLGHLTLGHGALAAGEPSTNPVVDAAAIDPSVSPCENFYRFACGNWIGKNPIPADRARWSRFDGLGERNFEKLHDILEAAAESPGGARAKIGDFCGIGKWHPAIEKCVLSADGKQRTLSLNGGGTWQSTGANFNSTAVPDGNVDLHVVATDAAGNTTRQ